MSQKRLLEEGASQSAARELRRWLSALPSLGRRVTDAELQRPPILEFLVQGLVGRFRLVVREELNKGLQRILQSDPRPRIQINVQHPFKLHFSHRLPQTLYTGDWIRSERGEIVQVVVRNAMTRDIIRTGELSCMTIKIIVLDGGFDGDDEGSWTTQQFHSSEMSPREGKGPLLKGELKIKLQDGIACLKGIAFTDNSHWRRTGKFKLGASLIRNRKAEGVRETISEAFVVKDGRGKASQKPDSPAFSDEVWRLINIRKDGKFHRNLKDKGVETLVEFRMRLAKDPGGLRRILGSRMSDKMWKQTVDHALKCEMPEEVAYGASLEDSPEVLIARPRNVVSSVVLMPQLQTSLIRSQGINCQWNPGEHEAQSSDRNQSSLANFTGNPEPLIPQGADLNFFQPADTFNVGGASGSNYFGSADDPLLSPLNVTAAMCHDLLLTQLLAEMPSKSFNTMNCIHGCQADRGCRPSTSEFAANHPSPADEDALLASFLVSSPDLKGKPIRNRWLKVGAVLKWSIKKKVPKKKRWLKVIAVLKLTLTKAVAAAA